MAKSLRLSLYLTARSRRSAVVTDDMPPVERQRLGHATQERPNGPLVWFHTGNDTAAHSITELSKRMIEERHDLSILITNSAAENTDFGAPVLCQAVPDENVPAIRSFLDHWSPDVAVFTEPDFRPALISETAQRSIPLFFIDADTHDPLAAPSAWPKALVAEALRSFTLITTGDRGTAARLRMMGADPARIEIKGFLQEGAPALGCDEDERDSLALLLASRPTWLAAAVTEDEIDAVLSAHVRAQRRSHRLLLLLVPDDLSLVRDWTDRLRAEGFKVARRSKGDDPETDIDIFIADVEGEMGLWYRLSPISFLGRSLVPKGGITPLEPAALGSAVVHGPNVKAHRAEYDRMAAAGAARLVRSKKALGDAVEELLSPARAAELARQAWEVTSAGAEVTDRVIDLILTEIEFQ